MRKINSILLACLLCLIFAMAVTVSFATSVTAAELETDNTLPEIDNTEPSLENKKITLNLDNQNIYEGMASAYKDGYQPIVQDSKAIIVVPLLCDGEIEQNTLTASVELGNIENSPFVYRNYEKDFERTVAFVNGTEETKEVFLISFSIDLIKNRYNGIYPITIQVRGTDENGGEIQLSYTSYVVITDGIDPNQVNSDTKDSLDINVEEKPTSAPIVLISKTVINPESVKAGEDFEAILTLKNTSTTKSIQNMVITVGVPSSDFELKNESNTIFVEKLGCEKTKDISLKYHVNKSVVDGNYSFEISMSYDDSKANTLSSSGMFQVTIEQPLTVELTMPFVQKEMTVGDTIPMTFQVMNLGRSTIYNVRCDITCNGLSQTKTAFIGNMESGTSGEGTLNLFVSQMEGKTAYGKTSGIVTLIYEDGFGNEQTQEYPFETTIIEKPEINLDEQMQKQEERASQWWFSIFLIVSIILIIGCSASAYYMGRKKR